jgi:hypothetical protein
MHRNLWIKLAKIWGQVGGGQLAVGGRDPPLAGLAGATVAALNTYKKNFLKNKKIIYQTSQIVQKCQLHKQRSKRMKSKLATVVFKGQEWVVIDTTETRDEKVFCKLMSLDGTTVLHAWVDINLIVGII